MYEIIIIHIPFIMTHQTLSIGNYWKLFSATLTSQTCTVERASFTLQSSVLNRADKARSSSTVIPLAPNNRMAIVSQMCQKFWFNEFV